MKVSEYKNIYQNEEKHFFYKSTHAIILSLIERYRCKSHLQILDAGCGTGLLGTKMKKFGTVIGIDMNNNAIKYARQRRLMVKKSSITKLPFKTNRFDLVTCIDVINHKAIKNDIKALKELQRVLKPGGILILRVSANSWLKLAHDKHVFVVHRYNRMELKNNLKESSFHIKKLSYTHMILLPIAVLKMFAERFSTQKKSESAIVPLTGLLNKVMTLLLIWESYVISYVSLPFGLGLIAVCKKANVKTF